MHRILIALVGLVLLVVPSPASADGHVVAIIGEDYQPFDVTVDAGDTVTWVNEGGAAHNVRSVDGLFSSPTLNNGLRYSFTFVQPGTFDYRCGIHPFMTGTVRVSGTVPTATATPAAPTPNPTVAPPVPTPTAVLVATVPAPISTPVDPAPTQVQPPAPVEAATTTATTSTATASTATTRPATNSAPTIASSTSTRPAATTSPKEDVIAPSTAPLPPSSGDEADNSEGSGPSTGAIFGITLVTVVALAGAWWLARGWWR